MREVMGSIPVGSTFRILKRGIIYRSIALDRVGIKISSVAQEWRNGRRAGFRCLLWQHSVGSSPISCIFLFGSACGSVGIGRRARLRILCWLQRVGSSPIFRTEKGNRKIPFFLSLLQYNGIRLLWNGSSAGMSVRLTRERSWVRTPSVPRSRRPAEILTASKVRYLCGFLSSHEP